jgi:hypothetical protein
LPRAGKYASKLDGFKPGRERTRLILALRGQRNFRTSGMPAGKRPLGLTVAYEIKA